MNRDDALYRVVKEKLEGLSRRRGESGLANCLNAAKNKNPQESGASKDLDAPPVGAFKECDGGEETADCCSPPPLKELDRRRELERTPRERPHGTPWEDQAGAALLGESYCSASHLEYSLEQLEEEQGIGDTEHGFECLGPPRLEAAARPPAGTDAANGARTKGPRKRKPTVMTDAMKRHLLTLVRAGFSKRQAAAMAGIARSTIARAEKRDADFARRLRLAAEAGRSQPLLEVIRASRKNWKAAAFLLDRLDRRDERRRERRRAIARP